MEKITITAKDQKQSDAVKTFLQGMNIHFECGEVVKTSIEGQQDWWDEISKEQQIAIDKALDEMKAGKLTPHEEVIKKRIK